MPKKKTAPKKATMTKAAFVRSLPADMPAKEVIAKGKEQGLTLTEDTVYKTRSLANAKKGTGKVKRTAKKEQSPTAKGKGRRGSKKARVLEQVAAHPDWSADQIAKAAKCSLTYVYSVWREGNGKAGKTSPSSPPTGATTDFYRAVKKVGGVVKAKELLATIEAFQNA